MSARRPYASRGVPRRATSYQSGSRKGRTQIRLALGVLAALILAACFAVLSPALLALPLASGLVAGLSRSSSPGASSSVSMLAAGATDARSGLQPGEVAVPGAAAGDANPLPTAIPMLHRWDLSSPGLTSDPVLAGRLDRALAGVDGHVSLAVKDLGSGRGAALDGDRELPAASLYKLPVLYSVFEAGLNMNEELPITDDARSYDAGSLELGTGESLSVAEALERMVTISDNTSAVMLGTRVGSSRVNANIAALGMETTHYSLDRMTTSALDMLHLLDLIATGRAVSPAASADMVHLLLRQRVNDRLPRLLPGDVEIAHKTGNLPGTVNDVGIVYGPSSTLVIAVLISDTTDETMAATSIARVGQAAYGYFADEPEVDGRPTIPVAPARAVPPVWRESKPVPPTPFPEPTRPRDATLTEPTGSAQAAEPTPINTLVSTPTAAAMVAAPSPTPTPAAHATPTAAPAAPTAAPPTATLAAARAATPTPNVPATATPAAAPAQATRVPTHSVPATPTPPAKH